MCGDEGEAEASLAEALEGLKEGKPPDDRRKRLEGALEERALLKKGGGQAGFV